MNLKIQISRQNNQVQSVFTAWTANRLTALTVAENPSPGQEKNF